MENEQLHNRMMSILRQRAANGEGEYGGFAKDKKLTYKQYLAVWKGRHGTAKGAKAAYAKLQKSKRKAPTKRKAVAKIAGVRKAAPKKHKLSDWQKFLKRSDIKGLSMREKSDLYQYERGNLEGPVRTRPASKSANILHKASDILENLVDEEGKLPKEVSDTVDTIKKITTKYERTGRKAHLPIPPGMMKKIAVLEAAKLRDPLHADNYELQIRHLLASGEGEGYDDYYDIY